MQFLVPISKYELDGKFIEKCFHNLNVGYDKYSARLYRSEVKFKHCVTNVIYNNTALIINKGTHAFLGVSSKRYLGTQLSWSKSTVETEKINT